MKTQIKHHENRISSNFKNSLRGQDSNLRPFGYEPNELPTAPPRDLIFDFSDINTAELIYFFYMVT